MHISYNILIWEYCLEKKAENCKTYKLHLYCYHYQNGKFPISSGLAFQFWFINSFLLDPTFQQALIIMLSADLSQSPQAPEDGSVSAPIVTVESSKQFATCMKTSVKEKWVSLGLRTMCYNVWCLVTQSCLTLWDPMDCSLSGFSEYWNGVPIPPPEDLPRDWTQISRFVGGFFTSWATREAQWQRIKLQLQ